MVLQFLKNTLNRQPCERLLASPRRQLLCEGPVTLLGRLLSRAFDKTFIEFVHNILFLTLKHT